VWGECGSARRRAAARRAPGRSAAEFGARSPPRSSSAPHSAKDKEDGQDRTAGHRNRAENRADEDKPNRAKNRASAGHRPSAKNRANAGHHPSAKNRASAGHRPSAKNRASAGHRPSAKNHASAERRGSAEHSPSAGHTHRAAIRDEGGGMASPRTERSGVRGEVAAAPSRVSPRSGRKGDKSRAILRGSLPQSERRYPAARSAEGGRYPAADRFSARSRARQRGARGWLSSRGRVRVRERVSAERGGRPLSCGRPILCAFASASARSARVVVEPWESARSRARQRGARGWLSSLWRVREERGSFAADRGAHWVLAVVPKAVCGARQFCRGSGRSLGACGRAKGGVWSAAVLPRIGVFIGCLRSLLLLRLAGLANGCLR
jgi:hypothetical protein